MTPPAPTPHASLHLVKSLVLLSWLSSSACTGERWLLETVRTSDAGLSTTGAATPDPCDEAASPPAAAPDVRPEAIHMGQWYSALANIADEDQVALPSGPLRLTVGATEISLQFGDGTTALPPPEANTGYLCPMAGPSSCTPPSGLIAGHSYHALEGFARNAILHLRFSRNEPWHSWCQMQSPEPRPGAMDCPPTYSIEPLYTSPRWGASCSVEREGQSVPIDCVRLTTVEHAPCNCNAEQCWAAPTRRVELNLRWSEQDTMRGTFWYGNNQAIELELERSSPAP